MPLKEVPVPTGEEAEEAQEPQEVQPEEVLVVELPELIPQPKPIKKEESWTKAVPKRKAKKEEAKVDLKQRMPCPICKRICTLHALLYTHQCTKDAREAKLKKNTEITVKPPVIEQPVPLPEPEVIEEKQPMTYREALIERRFQMDARQRELHTTPIRNYFRRAY